MKRLSSWTLICVILAALLAGCTTNAVREEWSAQSGTKPDLHQKPSGAKLDGRPRTLAEARRAESGGARQREIEAREAGLRKVKLGMSPPEVEELCGEPDRSSYTESIHGTTLFYRYGSRMLYFRDGRLVSLRWN